MDFKKTVRTTIKWTASAIATLAMAAGIFVLPTPDAALATQCWLTVEPSTITKGETAVITWKKHNAGEHLTIDNGIGLVGEGQLTGTVTIKPNQTTTYIGTNKNSNHTMTCKVTVKVVEPKPVCTLYADKTEIEKGQTVALTWTSENTTDSGTLNPGQTIIALSGNANVTPSETTTYTTNFKGKDGSYISCEKTVKVKDLPPPIEPDCTLAASASSIVKGSSVTLTWTSENAASGSMSPVPGSIALDGSTSVSPQTNTTYVATFTGEAGKTVICEKAVTVTEPTPNPGPTCDMSINPTSVRKDGAATLTWSSTNAASASIDQGIGSVSPNGSQGVTVSENKTYTGTFKHSDGREVQCTATIRIETSGGGGRCLNCDDDDDDDTSGDDDDDDVNPSIVLSRNIDLAEPRFITLTEVPYTGFSAGPVLTAAFWLVVVALSALIAYFLTYTKPFGALARVVSADAIIRYEEETDRKTVVRQSVAAAPAPVRIPKMLSEASAVGSGSLDDTIEEMAHREHILFSPEALRTISAEASKAPSMLTKYLDNFFAEVKVHFAPEDGWTLLSKERVNTVSVAMRTSAPAVASAPAAAPAWSAPAPVAEVRAQAAPVAHAEAPKAQTPVAVVRQTAPVAAAAPVASVAKAAAPAAPITATIPSFIGFLAGGKQEDAFAQLRDIHSKEGTASPFIAEVVRALDEVYKHRIEGNHSPDAAVAATVATLSNGELEKVIGILVESVDYSYSSARIGAKVAVAKVFEYFEKTKVQA